MVCLPREAQAHARRWVGRRAANVLRAVPVCVRVALVDRAVRAAELLDLAERVEQLEAAEQERATANGASLNGRMR